MVLPALPTQGSTAWYSWAGAVHNLVTAEGVTFQDFGAVGDGVTDDTVAIQAAVNATATSADRTVTATPGKVYLVSSVTLPSTNDITLVLRGATIQTTTAGVYAFTQTVARRQVRIFGGRFTGLGSGLNFTLTASDTQSFDVQVCDARFVLPTAQTALNITGARECVIRDTFFQTCIAIHLHQTINTQVIGCQMKDCAQGIWADGQSTGDQHDAGLMVTNNTIIGAGIGLNLICWDYVSVTNSMIDFCDHPVVIVNCTAVHFIANYTSNRDVGGTSYPVIDVSSNGALPQGGNVQHVKIIANEIINHSTLGTVVGINLAAVTWVHITSNQLSFWRTYGIRVQTSADYVIIAENVINGVGSPTAAIAHLSTSTHCIVRENYSSNATTGLGAGITVVNNFTP